MPVAAGQFAVTATPGFVGWLIRWATRSTVNHAVLCVGDTGECVEAQPHGVRMVKADAYPHAIWSNEPLTPHQVGTIAGWGLAHVGERYGWITIAAIVLELAHIKPRWLLRELREPGSLICSELVARAYQAAGITLVPTEWIGRVRPDELLAAINNQKEVHHGSLG